MKNKFLSEIIIVLLILLILGLYLTPRETLLSHGMDMMMTAALAVVFGIFAVFVWQEQARDEREILHRMLAGRVAYLVGSGVLVIGIIAQDLNHRADPWLVLTLMAMVLTKVLGSAYTRWRN